MKYLIRLFNFLKIPYCLTFASNSIQMSSYNSESRKKYWQSLLSMTKNIDILNPTNTINNYRGKKFLSPTSFPYLLQLNPISREKFENTDRKNIIVFCGSFIPQKNPVFAIEGFSVFLKEYSGIFPDVVLVMIGKGVLNEEIFVHARRINREFNREAIVLEKESRIHEVLSESKIFLSLQDYDNYPSQSVMESMLFCNSVISIANGDTEKLIKPIFNNVLLKEKDSYKLAVAIKDLLGEWKLNLDNRNHVLKKFSIEEYVRYFFKMHSEIIS